MLLAGGASLRLLSLVVLGVPQLGRGGAPLIVACFITAKALSEVL
jgi:hypothetical protein